MRAAVLALLAACDDLGQFAGEPTTLAAVTIVATGEATGDLHAALVWGTQWLPEPLCFLPPESPEVAAVIAAGCRDVLAFTPMRPGASRPIVVGEPAVLDIVQLPSADVMVGGLTARIAYASIVVFDDIDGDGVLTLGRARLLPAGVFDGGGGPDANEAAEAKIGDPIVGASFVSMTEPDQRLAFREGEFVETGFYPRHGCGVPPRGFSVLAAGGFSYDAAIAATLAGELPSQDPAACSERAPDAAAIEIPMRPALEVGCEQRRDDSSVQYRDPPIASPLAGHAFACAPIPALGDDTPTGITQLVVATAPDEACKGLTHYALVGCEDSSLECDHYEWDLRANPPGWWPCE